VDVGTISAVTCTPAVGGSVAAGANIVCSFNYTAPGTQGGADETTTVVTFTGTTGAANDSVASNNIVTTPATMLDAVNDTASAAGGLTGQSSNLASNDQFPAWLDLHAWSPQEPPARPRPSAPPAQPATPFRPAAAACQLPGLRRGTERQHLRQRHPDGDGAKRGHERCLCERADGGSPRSKPDGSDPDLHQQRDRSGSGHQRRSRPVRRPWTSARSALSPAPRRWAAAWLPAQTIVCSFNYTAPGTQGGADETTTVVTFTGTTGAANDSVASNNIVTTPATMLDAVNDTASAAGGLTGQSSNLASNDQFPSGSTFTLITAGTTCAAPTVSATGTAGYTVPASGSCLVNYQVCAAAPNAATCDTATLTVTAQSADMSAAFANVPTVVRPGQSLTGLSLTCTNSATAAASATSATCAPTVDVGSISAVTCTPAVGGSVAAGANDRLQLQLHRPGHPGRSG
jgi:hypothetical protein